MKNINCLFKVQLSILFLLTSWNCSDTPIQSNLDHSNLQIDTVTIFDMVGKNYTVSPNLGSNERLYLGKKNDIEIPISFIKMPLANYAQPNYWAYLNDTSITVDSLRFVLFSNDSLLNEERSPSLFFSPDSQFDENTSTYLDYENYSLTSWLDIGKPNVIIGIDSLTFFTKTEIIWDIDTLIESLSDTLDSNLVRTFAIKLDNSDSTSFIEIFSEEASQGENDPQIIMYYRKTSTTVTDTTIIDTTDIKIYSTGDLSIFHPNITNNNEENILALGNGRGLRTFFQIPSITDSIPNGSLIRNADLSFHMTSNTNAENYNLILDPITQDTSLIDSTIVYSIDPFNTIGYPYRVSGYQDSNRVVFPIKNILQNMIMGNENNFGFKIVSDEKNEPFHTILLSKHNDVNRPRLEIVYVYD